MTDSQNNSIVAPSQRLNHLQRDVECITALKESFEAIAFAAQRAGWTADETALAMLRLAGAYMNECVTASAARERVRSARHDLNPERRSQQVLDWLLLHDLEAAQAGPITRS